MSKQSIKATIDANIKQNGVQAITGQIMNSVLNQMVDNLAEEASTTEKLSELESEVIYDVTANNSGATFASLSALLSSEDLSTLIPITARCGGMSIRFVKSSDNKYVQFRCMANEFTTNVTQWQGVDEEPTANSQNLVYSGGIIPFVNHISPFFKFTGSGTKNSISIETLWIFIPGSGWKELIINQTYQFPVSGGSQYAVHFLVYNRGNDSVRAIYNGADIAYNETVLLYYDRTIDEFSGGVLFNFLYEKINGYPRYALNRLDKYFDFVGSCTNNSISIESLWIFSNSVWEEVIINETFTFPVESGEAYTVQYLVYNMVSKTIRAIYDYRTITADEVILLYWSSIYGTWEGGTLFDCVLSNLTNFSFTDEQCITRFVVEMNKVAKTIGMNDSVYYEPAGYPNTRNTTTAKDLLKLAVYASGMRQINDAWGKRSATINVYGTNARTINITGPSNADFEQSYDILGWKPGEAHEYGTNTWIMVVRSKTTSKIYVLSEYDLDNNPSSYDYPQIKAALDYIDGTGQQPSFSHGSICIAELPKETPSLFSGVDIPLLYSYNPTSEFVQASTTKVMTLLTASITGVSESERVTLKSSDIQPGSGTTISAGDILTIRDIYLCGMLPSSNTAMYALARIIGKKLLKMDN